MNKWIILFLLSFFVIACSTPNTGGPQFTNIYTGSEGLKIEFAKEFPPDKIFEGSNMLLALNLENAGAARIENGKLALSLEQDYMRLVSWNRDTQKIKSTTNNGATFSLDGKTTTNPNPQIEILTADLKTHILERQTETHTSNIVLTACYPYKTHFEENVCIDTDIFGLSPDEKNCEVKTKSHSSQGAPVAVVKRETKMIPSPDRKFAKPIFTINMKNVGRGEIIDTDAVQRLCSSAPVNKEDFNQISVTATLGGRTLSCKPKDFQLFKDKDFVICTLPQGLDVKLGSYVTPLVVDLEYGYTESISKKIEIRRIG